MGINSNECAWLDSLDLTNDHRARAARLLVRLGVLGHQAELVDVIDGNVNVFARGTLFVVHPTSSKVTWAMAEGERSGEFFISSGMTNIGVTTFGHSMPPWWGKAT